MREHRRQVLQLLMLSFRVGDVLDLGDEVERRTFLVAHQRDREEDPDNPPGRREVTLLDLVGPDLAEDELIEVTQVEIQIIGVSDVLERHREELVLGIAGQLGDRGVHLPPCPVQLDDGLTDRGVLEGEPVSLLGLPQ